MPDLTEQSTTTNFPRKAPFWFESDNSDEWYDETDFTGNSEDLTEEDKNYEIEYFSSHNTTH